MIEIDPKITDIVWFDLDDTLVDFRHNSRVAMEEIFESSVLKDWYQSFYEWWEAYEPVNNSLWSLFNHGQITAEQLRKDRFTVPLVSAGMDEAAANRLAPMLDRNYLEILALQKTTIPGAKELLGEIKENNLLTGVLSNGFNGIQQEKLRSAGLSELIDITVLSDDIGINKPDERLYKYAMERSGIHDPGGHLMIGDNPVTDIAGALNAGWRAVLFDRHNMLYPPENADRITDFSQIEVKKCISGAKIMQK